jgi:hypothetical protein
LQDKSLLGVGGTYINTALYVMMIAYCAIEIVYIVRKIWQSRYTEEMLNDGLMNIYYIASLITFIIFMYRCLIRIGYPQYADWAIYVTSPLLLLGMVAMNRIAIKFMWKRNVYNIILTKSCVSAMEKKEIENKLKTKTSVEKAPKAEEGIDMGTNDTRKHNV